MANGGGNPGMNRLAQVLNKRIQRYSERVENNLVLDFGVINSDLSLTTFSYPKAIPKSDYYIGMELVTGESTC